MIFIPNVRKYVSTRVTEEFHPVTLANSLFSGLLIYILEVIFVISFTALIFSGQMSNQLPKALGFILLGNALLIGLTALLSSYPVSIGVAQDTPGAVLGVVATTVVTALPAVAVE